MRAENKDQFDALIVGSGISGVLIAKRLGEANKRILILEAGQGLPPDINDYMNRFFTATPKVPESPYPPELFHGSKLTDPTTVNAGRPTVLSLNPRGTFGDWQDPKQSYLIQDGPLAFGSTYERVNGGTRRSRRRARCSGPCGRAVPEGGCDPRSRATHFESVASVASQFQAAS